MTTQSILSQIALGEDSTRQFKADVKNAESLASDKRRVSSKEELRRLFQFTNQFHADELPTKAGIDRNPILFSYVAKGLLPYHGLGTGIKRSLAVWSAIDFVDDHDGCLFTAMVYRKSFEELALAGVADNVPVETREKTPDLVLQAIRGNPRLTLAEVADTIGKSLSAVERSSTKLAKGGKLRYVGPQKGGHWEVQE
ncbi:MAG: hypothetical protein A2286_06850 [Gammaproteobacteria bacterium RIFOXYA12_FULL_61_12]|nr:MAG: hypothetical protein A2286_06850 [Gammaproteobacteria bacterium RIFOXYA12_FULL_61_12]